MRNPKPISAPNASEVTVIIPCYNPNEFLFETLECLFHQTFKYFQIIIVNDGSTNIDSIKKFDQVKEIYPSVKIVVHPENKGLPAARNTGIQNSNSPYIFFIDGDDLLDHTALEKYYLTLVLNPSLSFVNSYVIGFGAQNYDWQGGFHDGPRFLYENRTTSCFIARKELFSHLMFDETLRSGCEDWDFWLHAASKGFWGHTIPEYLFKYRRTDCAERWQALSSASKIEEIGKKLRAKYESKISKSEVFQKKLTDHTFQNERNVEVERLSRINHFQNKNGKRLFVLLPWLEMGGADKFNIEFLKGLKEKGWTITICCSLESSHPWKKIFSQITDDIFFLHNYTTVSGFHQVLGYLVSERKIDKIFISNSQYGYQLLPFLKSRFPHIPIVDYIHCEDPDWINGGYPTLNISFNKWIDQTIVASNYLKNYLIAKSNNSIQSDKIEVCYINIDTKKHRQDIEKRKDLRSRWGVPEDYAVILFAARFTSQKQPFVLAETIKKLKEHTSNFVCIAIGDGPLLESFRSYVFENKIEDKIWCMGALKHEDVLGYMDASDIFFLPSAYEGIALSIYESMAKGLVVVGADVGGQKELVSSKDGYLIERTNPQKEADEYCRILNELVTDGNKREIFKKAAREKIENGFEVADMINKMDLLIGSAVSDAAMKDKEYINEYMLLNNMYFRSEKVGNELWRDIVYFKKQIESKELAPGHIFDGDDNTYKNEFIKIKEWYNKEYDVLPLWFKRLGHIVKVFQGHRSLKSLFE